jgi:ankyrin repeat protein
MADVDELILAALRDDRATVEPALAEDPGLPARSPVLASALADSLALTSWLATPDASTSLTWGPGGWPLLTVLCSSRWMRDETAHGEAREAAAWALLVAGADPTAHVSDLGLEDGLASPLALAVKEARCPRLAAVLREGRPPELDANAVWAAARNPPLPEGGHLALLELAFAGERPHWVLNGAIAGAAEAGNLDNLRWLLDAGASARASGGWGRAGGLVHMASWQAHGPEVLVPLATLLLDRGAELESTDRDGRTPLALAVALGQSALARTLLARGADEAVVREEDRGLGARIAGDPEAIAELRRAEEPEPGPPVDAGLFESAAQAVADGEVETLAALLDEHPELTLARSPRPHRCTLLHYVGANGIETKRQRTPTRALEVLRLLLARGSAPDALAATYGGGPRQTTLCLLASSGWPAQAGLQEDLVHALVEGGADPDGVEQNGAPLATALQQRCPDAARALFDHARLDDPRFAAAAGRVDLLDTALEPGGLLRPDTWLSAIAGGDPLLVAGQALAWAALMDAGAALEHLLGPLEVDPSAPVPHGATALHEAAFAGHLDAVSRLLDAGADVSRRDGLWDSTAFGWAMEGDRDEVAALMLSRWKPDLFDAIEYDLVERVAELLREDRALADAPDGSGRALRLAAWYGRDAHVELLLEAGADPGLRSPDRDLDAAGAAALRGHEALAERLRRACAERG